MTEQQNANALSLSPCEWTVQLIQQPCSSEQISPQRIVPLQLGKMYKIEKEFLKSPARTTLVQSTARPDIPVLSKGLRRFFLPRGCNGSSCQPREL